MISIQPQSGPGRGTLLMGRRRPTVPQKWLPPGCSSQTSRNPTLRLPVILQQSGCPTSLGEVEADPTTLQRSFGKEDLRVWPVRRIGVPARPVWTSSRCPRLRSSPHPLHAGFVPSARTPGLWRHAKLRRDDGTSSTKIGVATACCGRCRVGAAHEIGMGHSPAPNRLPGAVLPKQPS